MFSLKQPRNVIQMERFLLRAFKKVNNRSLTMQPTPAPPSNKILTTARSPIELGLEVNLLLDKWELMRILLDLNDTGQYRA